MTEENIRFEIEPLEYVYLLQEREFIKTGENIFKIGKTKRSNITRFEEYPKDSHLYLHLSCSDCDKLEKEMIKTFKKKFKYRKDIGNEYFQGNVEEMLNTILELRMKANNIHNPKLNPKVKKIVENTIVKNEDEKLLNVAQNIIEQKMSEE